MRWTYAKLETLLETESPGLGRHAGALVNAGLWGRSLAKAALPLDLSRTSIPPDEQARVAGAIEQALRANRGERPAESAAKAIGATGAASSAVDNSSTDPIRRKLDAAFHAAGQHYEAGRYQLAIAAYSESIKYGEDAREQLGEALPPVLQHALATAYGNRGIALSALNQLSEAVEDFDRAIALREALRTSPGGGWTSEFDLALSAAYGNRGRVLCAFNQFSSALADCTSALRLMEALRVHLDKSWTPAHQSDLAGAYRNRGNVRSLLHQPSEAVEDFDHAVALGEALRMQMGETWPPPFQNDLATAYSDRSLALWELESPHAAIRDLRHAVRLLEKLSVHFHFFLDRYAEYALKLVRRLIDRYATAQIFEEANDLAENVLQRLSRFEAERGTMLRFRRETAFAQTLETYRRVSPGHIPELIRENLDPSASGSAVDSYAMYEEALRHLNDLSAREDFSGKSWSRDVVAAQAFLLEVHALYFAGTLHAAKSRAQWCLREQTDAQGAEEELLQYMRRRPRDADGPLALAELLHRLGRPTDDIKVELERAIGLMLQAPMPTALERERVEKKLNLVLQAGGRLLLGDITSLSDEEVEGRFMSVVLWQREPLPGGKVFRDDWKATCDAAQRPFRTRKRRWLEVSTEEARQLERSRLLALHHEFPELLQRAVDAPLPRSLADAADVLSQGILGMIEEFALPGPESAAATPPEPETNARAMAARLGRELAALPQSELSELYEMLAESYPDTWPALDDGERQLVAMARHLIDHSGDEPCARFAVLSLGFTVEGALQRLVYNPLREERRRQGASTLIAVDGDVADQKLAAYLDAVPGARLHLGPGVTGFVRAIRRGSGKAGAGTLIRQRIESLPHKRGVLDVYSKVLDARARELDFVVQLSNRCALFVGDPPSRAELERVWDAVIGHPQLGFLRYFAVTEPPALPEVAADTLPDTQEPAPHRIRFERVTP